MRTGLLWVLGAWLFAAAPIVAQSPPPDPPDPDVEVSAPLNAPARSPDLIPYWVRAEYLAYWVKNAPLPVSLVTGDPANPTQELLNSDRGLGMFSGFRVGAGAWLDPGNSFGWDGDFFCAATTYAQFHCFFGRRGQPDAGVPVHQSNARRRR